MTKEENHVSELPLCRAVTQIITLMGAPKVVILGNAMIALLFIVDFGFFWILFVNLIIHLAAIRLAKDDAQFADCLKIYLYKKKFYCT
jgi:type IV secretory pathway TrbD component